jgi:hypothetical protein
LATDCTLVQHKRQGDNNEFITPKLISIDEFLQYGRSERVADTDALFLGYEQLLALK